MSVPSRAVELLTAEPRTLFLATCRDGRPHVAPVWFLYDDGVIELVTSGRKLADLRENPYVSMSTERAERGQPEWTVTLRGRARVVDDDEQFRAVNRRINEKYGAQEGDWEQENTLVRVDVGSASYQTYD